MTDIWKKVTSEKAEELTGVDELDPDSMSPRDALNELYKLKKL